MYQEISGKRQHYRILDARLVSLFMFQIQELDLWQIEQNLSKKEVVCIKA